MTSYFETFLKQLNNATNVFTKASIAGKALIIIILVLLIIYIFKGVTLTTKEGFIQTDKFLYKENVDAYDDFYANIYDYLVFNDVKNKFEVGEIINQTIPSSESKILDIGCGTGHHVANLAAQNLDIIGIDISKAMIKKAKENYPDKKFMVADALDPSDFEPETFTHILCMYFTIYYFKDKRQFFENAYRWLMPGGYLIVHLVDRDKFNPILPIGNEQITLMPSNKRITKTNVELDDMTYMSDFKFDPTSEIGTFIEKFRKKSDGNVRKQEHTLYMPSADDIVQMGQETGFILQGIVNLLHCQYEYQYLYIFVRPT
jgi:ubiquinone/menaquinone biosynthesis C-methylase UbiE